MPIANHLTDKEVVDACLYAPVSYMANTEQYITPVMTSGDIKQQRGSDQDYIQFDIKMINPNRFK